SGLPVTIAILTNDTDPENDIDPSSVQLVGTSQPGDSLVVDGQGTWSVEHSTGSVKFTPVPDFTADPDPVSYTVSDTDGLTSTPATITVIVNHLPLAVVDVTKTIEGGESVSGNLLTNEVALGDLPTTVITVTQGSQNIAIGQSSTTAAGGQLLINAEGSYTYAPPAKIDVSEEGLTEVFDYTIADKDGEISSATLTVVVKNATVTTGSSIQISNPPVVVPPTVTPPVIAPVVPQITAPGLLAVVDKQDTSIIGNTYNADGQQSNNDLMMFAPMQHFDITLAGSIPNQVVLELQPYSFSIPSSTFRHSDPNEELEFKATRIDGTSLPDWLHFNTKTMKFTGEPPKGAIDERVLITARDTYGNEVHATFTVRVSKDNAATPGTSAVTPESVEALPNQQPNTVPDELPPENGSEQNAPVEDKSVSVQPQAAVGKSGLSEQIYVVGNLSKLQESRALLDSLKYL
ncbi:MAG: putative Ig domain-containing protein, partial [Methylovulum sp.]|nr:putative Ig domain-containing protein [Methylovulum sp.]MCF7998216.1 putative Ig domain-containing protein [Methylovulum sp.]